MSSRSIFISADHGLALVYFLQSSVVHLLHEAGYEVVVLTDDHLAGMVAERFAALGIRTEGLRIDQARAYSHRWRDLQWWLAFLRRVGGSTRINTGAMDSYIEQVAVEEPNRRRILMPFARLLIRVLRHSAVARRALVRIQELFDPQLYGDLFDSYQPEMVIASTPGWRLDRYLLREARKRGVKTASVIVGWDNPSSYAIPGARVDYINCWSKIQEHELVEGSDWAPERVNIGGIPIYDGYFNKQWQMDRQAYFELHHLDPDRKLISYACSFVSFSPNIQNITALIEILESGELRHPSQLLIRLHPNHFMDVHLFQDERDQIHRLAEINPHVHVVDPVPLGGELGYYSGEDMPEKASMLAHSDVFVTVYSTMVVEAALHDTPVVSACIDSLTGWNVPRKYTLPLSKIGNWPTHRRFREARAGLIAEDRQALLDAINRYLEDPALQRAERKRFIEREITYTDGSAGQHTAEYLLSLLEPKP